MLFLSNNTLKGNNKYSVLITTLFKACTEKYYVLILR